MSAQKKRPGEPKLTGPFIESRLKDLASYSH